MRLRDFLGLFLLLAALLTGCTAGDKTVKPAKVESTEEQKVEFTLNRSMFEIVPWKTDNSHVIFVDGKITVDGQPVSGLTVQSKNRQMETDKNGTFKILLDQSKIQKISVQVASAATATLSGKPVSEKVQKQLLSQSQEIQVFYPIEISKVEPSTENELDVMVHGRAVVPDHEGSTFPTLVYDKYAMYGTVKDHNGNPVKDAVVNIRFDGVEGFSKSLPTNEKGEYSLYFLPEDEYKWLYVHVGDIHYELPEKKVFVIPEGTSVEANITLPETGNVIQDFPPYLTMKTAPGELYKGTIIGLNLDEKVPYQVSIPDKDGYFELTLPKEIWDLNPAFFQANMNYFSLKPLKPGDWLPSSILPVSQPHEPNKVPADMKPPFRVVRCQST